MSLQDLDAALQSLDLDSEEEEEELIECKVDDENVEKNEVKLRDSLPSNEQENLREDQNKVQNGDQRFCPLKIEKEHKNDDEEETELQGTSSSNGGKYEEEGLKQKQENEDFTTMIERLKLCEDFGQYFVNYATASKVLIVKKRLNL